MFSIIKRLGIFPVIFIVVSVFNFSQVSAKKKVENSVAFRHVDMVGLSGKIDSIRISEVSGLEQLRSDFNRLKTTHAKLVKGKNSRKHSSEIERFCSEYSKILRFVENYSVPPVAFIMRSRYGLKGTNATMFGHRTSVGSMIAVFDPSEYNAKPKVIFDSKEGFIFDMSASFDGSKLLFSFKKDNDAPFHIWEVGIDGRDLHQVTDGYYHDINPVYLPDGRIAFASSRMETYSMCQDYLACCMHVCNSDGSNIRRIDFTTLCSNAPSVTKDGRLLFSRWEYQDKNIFSWQGIWTLNPNGRNLKLFHGNTFIIPNSTYGPKEIPGTNKVIVTLAAHHHPPVGDIGIIDRSKGLESLESFKKITDATPYTITKGDGWKKAGELRQWSPGDKFYKFAYTDPYPVNEDYSLVALCEEEYNRFRLKILNHDGTQRELFSHPELSCLNPVPLNAKPVPQVIPGEVPLEKGEGTFYVKDIYEGLLQQGVKRGEVKSLRIMGQIPKTTHVQGPRLHDQYPITGMGSYYPKSDYGTVPVNENGSVYFKAPSNTEIYFIALDEEGKEVQRMGSVTQITTGEFVSCIGCHENRLQAPSNSGNMRGMGNTPADPVAGKWGIGPVDYNKQVQPVLDKYCIKCHSGTSPKAGIDLSGDKTRYFSMSYVNLCNPKYTEYYFLNTAPTGVFPAHKTGSYVSALSEIIDSEHGNANMDKEGKQAIYAWIDANVPYYSTFDVTRPAFQGGRDILEGGETEAAKKLNKILKKLKIIDKTILPIQKKWYLPQKPTDNSYFVKEELLINYTNPHLSKALVDNLAKSSGGNAPARKAIFKSKKDQNYIAILNSINKIKQRLEENPRIDMPGATPSKKLKLWGATLR
jgi:hypothetical protein